MTGMVLACGTLDFTGPETTCLMEPSLTKTIFIGCGLGVLIGCCTKITCLPVSLSFKFVGSPFKVACAPGASVNTIGFVLGVLPLVAKLPCWVNLNVGKDVVAGLLIRIVVVRGG
jgi:hypothetical protein